MKPTYLLRSKDLVRLHGISERTAARRLQAIKIADGLSFVTIARYAECYGFDVNNLLSALQ